jgi:hypothetical protein
LSALLAADLNNDKKLDFIWNNTVYLGKGDGTFKQMPLGIGSPIAIADLNGDGIADLVLPALSAATVYAGNGDGTFQSAPLYSAPLPQYSSPSSISIGDVNGDGHPDLLVNSLYIFLGDGKGNFVTDSNNPYYTVGTGVLVRLNNQAPKPPNDNALDFLVLGSNGATSVLNQLNPAPTAPSPLPSKTTLTTSTTSANTSQQITFTATVTGLNPTGNVTFVSGSTTLGTAAITNGVARLSYTFTTAATYPVTANYAGDTNNLASASSALSVVIAPVPLASTTKLTASITNANQNQQITFTATVTGVTPTGNVTFVAGTTNLGTIPLTNGTATLSAAFPAAGSYTVVANYAGDSKNLPSASSSVPITVIAPDYTVSATPTSSTIKAGQAASIALTVTPVGGYSGTVKFSCGSLPSEATCAFSPATATPTNGTAATTNLTVATTAPATAMLQKNNAPIPILACVGILCLAFSPRRTQRLSRRLTCLVILLLAGGLISISGCGNSPSTPKDPGTPAGTQSITVAVTDTASNASHSVTVQVVVQ